MSYTPLHVHSIFSNLDGLSKVEDIVDRCIEIGAHGVCISDHAFATSHYDLSMLCEKKGIKPIFAVEGYFTPFSNTRHERIEGYKDYYHLTMIAKDVIGYKNLMRLIADSFMNGKYRKPRTDLEQLERNSEGVIVLQSCFFPGTRFLTDQGYKVIESENCKLYNKKGEIVDSTPTSRPYCGKIKEVRTKNFPPFKCTEDHKIFTLSKSQYRNRKIRNNFSPEFTSDFKSLDSTLIPVKSIFPDEESLNLDFDTIFSVGAFTAEGGISRGKELVFTLHIDETKYSEKIISGIRKFDNSCKITVKEFPFKKTRKIWTSSKSFIDLCFNLVGNGTFEKFISYKIMNSPIEERLAFIAGYYYGDGYFRIRGKGTNSRINVSTKESVVATVSKNLAYDLSLLFYKSGIKSSFSTVKAKIDKNGVNHAESYYLYSYGKYAELIQHLHNVVDYELDYPLVDFSSYDKVKIDSVDYYCNVITSIDYSDYSGDVYCRNVPDGNSFIVNGSVVHNCLGGIVSQMLSLNRDEEAEQWAKNFKEIFGDRYYLELTYTGLTLAP